MFENIDAKLYVYVMFLLESVIFILSTGVQVKQFNVFGLATSTRFFPKSKIKAFVINETIRRVCISKITSLLAYNSIANY